MSKAGPVHPGCPGPHEHDTRALEARVLRRVAEAILQGYRPGYYGHGGPQDGDDEPPSFEAKDVVRDLERAADELDPPAQAAT